jgi:LEA14-like dessication related protein
LSSGGENSVIALLLLGVLLAVATVTYGYYSVHQPSTQQESIIENIQLRSTSADITGINLNNLSLRVEATVYNPNGFGAMLDAANYSVYANGRYLGTGQTVHEYELAPRSTQTLIFPISIGWKTTFTTMGSYIVDWGHVTWEIKGNAVIKVDGLSLAAPFEFTVS